MLDRLETRSPTPSTSLPNFVVVYNIEIKVNITGSTKFKKYTNDIEVPYFDDVLLRSIFPYVEMSRSQMIQS